MMDRTELLEAALDSLPDGMAVLAQEGSVAFWNRGAEAITGYSSVDVLARSIPEPLQPLVSDALRLGNLQPGSGAELRRGTLVRAQHKLGHPFQSMARTLVLRDGLGGRIGTAILFHPAEGLDALPCGEMGEGKEANQNDFADRLEALFEDFAQGGPTLSVLWIAIDQAKALHKTHGAKACEAMLDKVEHALAHGLRPAEELGRWGEDEFLVISHERTPEMLMAHAQTLAGMARTTDFRWWGDRVSLTVSIGAAQANSTETLAQLLEKAQQAMVSSTHAGGNHVTAAPGGQACLPL